MRLCLNLFNSLFTSIVNRMSLLFIVLIGAGLYSLATIMKNNTSNEIVYLSIILFLICLTTICSALYLKKALKPLVTLGAYAGIIAKGEGNADLPYQNRKDEIGELANNLAKVAAVQEGLESLAYYDPLTKAANRTFFAKQLQKSFGEKGKPTAIFMIDLDRFKEVNDALGHAAGDALLVYVTNALRGQIRKDDFLARLGGDEFAILVYNEVSKEGAAALGQRIVTLLSKPILLPQGEVSIGTSIGICLLPHDGDNAIESMQNADLALYRAKEKGRGQFQFFEPSLNNIAKERMVIGAALRQAIDNDGLSIHFQPQIKASSNELHGLEALARWVHPERGNISPSEFIPIAENCGLIVPLGNWMINESCRIAKMWMDNGFDFKHVSVNISPMQIWQPNFLEVVRHALKMHRLPAHLLCLEVTENLFVNHAEARVQKVLKELNELGVSLSLDDFGTGYSSLGYLNKLPFKQLKIDRAFVMDVDKDARRSQLLQGMISLGKGLGMDVVAEGAETQAEIDILINSGCDAVQGYFYSKPIPTLMVQIEIDKIIRSKGVKRNLNRQIFKAA